MAERQHDSCLLPKTRDNRIMIDLLISYRVRSDYVKPTYPLGVFIIFISHETYFA